ncbi:dipeptide/oligopeptide/nickel ABC transporter permease/ATP-binding protein [Mycolicibacterium tusciae]|uniref:dipeptide/oligopeptide/nickel ABC transporter permease/ATP-binding protein n=1 Tax=Mycolicibacterium tusciae TaxID=75922 RepID=UPI00024A42D3|nr:dipeptide/oligopeptide/nickel ABC transporter permease/ATP-binding protein [Mycolicibacterium tusciae]
MRTRSRLLAMVGLTLLGMLVFVALAAPLLAPYAPGDRVGRPFSAPSAAHWLGANDVGHDLLSELIYGARISLLIGIIAAVAATVIGASVGLLAGYARGWVDTALMRFVDVILALPVLPLTIVIGVFAGPGLITQVIVISAVIWAGIARELRAQVLSLRERDHIQALRAMGAGAGYVLPRHILPAVAPLLVPQFVLATKSAILLEASLAFLGLGDITAKSWGTTLSNAHARSAFLTDAWLWWVVPPGLAIAVTVLAFALLGYAFEERARPSLRDGLPSRSAPTRAAGPVDVDAPPLAIENLAVTYQSDRGVITAVDGLSLAVEAGELVGVVGESGSGKSTVTAAALALLPPAATVTDGTVSVQGRDLATLTAEELRALRGDRIALVPQDAISALNPVRTIRSQLTEAVRAHRSTTRAAARARADELLSLVGLDPARGGNYPHQFSGGMCQRVVIAMALINDPAVVVADEPTSGLDGVVQGGVLDLLDELRRRLNLALLIVSHDLNVVGRVADRIAVMQAGRIVEIGPTERVLTAPTHPFTRSLVDAVPRLTTAGPPP